MRVLPAAGSACCAWSLVEGARRLHRRRERRLRGGRLNAATIPGRRARLALSLPQLWALACVVGVFIILSLQLVRPHDFWWHARVGRWIVENGAIPRTDLFSFTRFGEPYAYQMWLMEVVLCVLLAAGGLPLVIFANAVAIAGAYAILLRICHRSIGGNLRWASLAALAGAGVGMQNWNIRPQAISFPLFAVTMYLLERRAPGDAERGARRQSDRALWWLPPLFALWANCHGAFVAGLTLVGVYLLGDLLAWLRRRRAFPVNLALASLFSAAAIFLTPLGLGMVEYVLGIFKHSLIQQLIVEWMPPTVRTWGGGPFFAMAVACITVMLVSGYRPAAHESLRLLVFGGLALTASRHTAWFGMAAAPTLAASLSHWTRTREGQRTSRVRRRPINLAVGGVIGLLGVLSLPWLRPYLPLPDTRRAYASPETPLEAVAFLRRLPSTPRVFHSEGYGSYMIWASPEAPVFVDTRIELYPEEQWRDYLAISYARHDWETILEKYGVDTLLLERDSQAWLIEAASAAPVWQRVYEDDKCVILQRRDRL